MSVTNTFDAPIAARSEILKGKTNRSRTVEDIRQVLPPQLPFARVTTTATGPKLKNCRSENVLSGVSPQWPHEKSPLQQLVTASLNLTGIRSPPVIVQSMSVYGRQESSRRTFHGFWTPGSGPRPQSVILQPRPTSVTPSLPNENLNTPSEKITALPGIVNVHSGTTESVESSIAPLKDEGSHRLEEDVTALVAKKKILLEEVAALEAQKQQLATESCATLSSERRALEDERATLTVEQLKLAKGNILLSSEKQKLEDERNKLQKEKDKLWDDGADLAMQKEELLGETAKLAQEREHLWIKSSEVTKERHHLAELKAKLESERMHFIGYPEEIQAKNAELQTFSDQLALEKAALKEAKMHLAAAEEKLAADTARFVTEMQTLESKKLRLSSKKKVFRSDSGALEVVRSQMDEREAQLKMREQNVRAREEQVQSHGDAATRKSVTTVRENCDLAAEKAEDDKRWAYQVSVLEQRVRDFETMLAQDRATHATEVQQLCAKNDELAQTVEQQRVEAEVLSNAQAEFRRNLRNASLKIPEAPPLTTCFAAFRLI